MEFIRKQSVFSRKATKQKPDNPRLVAASNCLGTTSMLSNRKYSLSSRLLGKQKSSSKMMNFDV